MNERTNQGGSVVAFVIVGVVLAGVVAGGVYLVNQRNKENIANQPSGGTNQPQSSSPTPAPSSNQGGSRGASPSPSTNQQNQSAQTSPPTTGVAQNGSLPTSGPADDGLRVLALSILIGVLVAYIRSQIRKQQPVSL